MNIHILRNEINFQTNKKTMLIHYRILSIDPGYRVRWRSCMNVKGGILPQTTVKQ